MKNHLVRLIGINASNRKEKYLGIPMASGKDKKVALEEIIEKVKSKLQGLKMKTLPQVGRASFITSVANSIPSYQVASLLLPKQVCSKLDALN